MASFSSWQGQKIHGHKGLLTDVLKNRMGFDGFVVGDWNAHGQVDGCTNTSCAAAINAGLDMFMAPDSWKELYENTLAQVRSGEIPMARLDDAVRRILRVKLRSGLFEAGKPSTRPLAGRFELLGSPEHRAVARQAVRESLVLLKNAKQLLPLRPQCDVLVAGDGADSIPEAERRLDADLAGHRRRPTRISRTRNRSSRHSRDGESRRRQGGAERAGAYTTQARRRDRRLRRGAVRGVSGRCRHARVQAGRQRRSRAAAQAQGRRHPGRRRVPLRPADVGQSRAERLRCLRRRLAARFRRRRHRRCAVREARRLGESRLQGQAAVLVAAHAVADDCEPGRPAAAVCVRLWAHLRRRRRLAGAVGRQTRAQRQKRRARTTSRPANPARAGAWL